MAPQSAEGDKPCSTVVMNQNIYIYIYIYMDVSALLRLKQRASRMAPSEFSFTATSQLTDPTIYLCSGSKPCSESTPCKRTTLFMIFLPPSCFLSLLPPSCFLRPPLRITMTHSAKHTSAHIHMHPSISFLFLLHCGCCCSSQHWTCCSRPFSTAIFFRL